MSLWGAPVSENEQTNGTPPSGDRRAGLTEEKVLLMIANALTAQTAAMEDRIIEAIDKKFDSRFNELDERVSAIHDVFTDHVAEAFPDGPLLGHKIDHEGRIKWAQTKEKIVEDLLIWSVRGVAGTVAVLLGLGVVSWFQKNILP
jgi:hypothetical protein